MTTYAEAKAVFEKVIPQEIRAAYKQLPAEKLQQIPFEVFEAHMVSEMRKQEATLISELEDKTKPFAAFFRGKMDEMLGALCLSEVPDSLLMWSHYAASHTGFVLEFDGRHTHFHEKRQPQDEFRHLRRVLYRDNRPSGLLSELDATDMFLVKSTQWSYEREWRILRSLSDADEVIESGAMKTHLFRFPADALNTVIVGARSSKEFKELVRDVLRGDPLLRHVSMKVSVPDESHFVVHIRGDDISVSR
ncbi:MAG: DUF2971 domain-containing protein [Thiobacillus sp.]|nr:DUF2971 domain-containing protein [Thiobacillus sp.]